MHRFSSFLSLFVAVLLIIPAIAQDNSAEKWSLEKCISYALENNLSISQSYLKQRSAELSYKQSKFERLPSVNGSASQSLLDPTTTSIGLNANMNLFNGFNTENAIKKNKLELEKQSIQTELAQFEIEIAVAEAFLQTLYYQENIIVAEKLLESNAQELKLAQAKFKVGSIAQKDLSDIEAQYANYEYSLVRSQNQYAQQRLTLKQLLELEPYESFEITSPDLSQFSFVVPTPDSVFAAACTIYPEMKNVQQQLAIDSLSIKMAQSSYYPSLSFSAGIGASGDFFDNESEWSGNKSLRLSLSVPIFNQWQTKTNVETAKINAEYNAIAVESAKKSLYKEIENACLNAEAYQRELQALELSLTAAEKSYQLAEKQFNVGATDATSLLVAQTNYAEASISYVQAKYMSILSYLVIQHYQGKSISL